jgi:DNA-binding CsgD family transcriptional regulator
MPRSRSKVSIDQRREASIINWLAQGWTAKEIADRLRTDPEDCRQRISGICRTRRALTRAHLIYLCMTRGEGVIDW